MFSTPSRYIDRIFIHCSATDSASHDNIETIRKWHTVDNGWSDIGYHYFIDKNGILHAGRPLNKTPAAQSGHNTGTIAICLSGLSDFTKVQFDTLNKLCDQIQKELPAVTFHGHKEVANKTCPVFDYQRVLGLDSKGVRTTNSVYDKPLKQSRTMANATVAGVTGTVIAAAPAIEPAGKVVKIAQENPTGLFIIIGLVLVVFAAIAIHLKLDDRRKTRDLVSRK